MAQLDTEWMKFMSRLSRQQNCDNDDASTDCEDDDKDNQNDICQFTSDTLPTSAEGSGSTDFANTEHHPTKYTTTSSNTDKPKKTCISKKAQRRTYSFLDSVSVTTNMTTTTRPDECIAVVQELETSVKTAARATAAAAPESGMIASSVRSKISPIYISTKTKIAYLNKPVNIYDAFWKVPVQHYYKRSQGVIKKQIKFQTTDPAFIASIKEKLEQQPRCYDEYIIEHIENPNGRIQYKDQRKVSIGICKKDLQGGNSKKKRAFFNCFVLILRINGGIAPIEERAPEDDILYKEMHVKVFNIGKLEIPGIQEDATLIHVLQLLVTVLRPHLGDDLDYIQNRCETALINSNFNCGFYINRDKLFQLLKYKYRMNCNYDSCSYPGIQSKFYYIPDKKIDEQSGQQPVSMDIPYYEVSFMIFRTGSILIVGKCNEEILLVIYRFICSILETEYSQIQMGEIPLLEGTSGVAAYSSDKGVKNARKKKINITNIRLYNEDNEV